MPDPSPTFGSSRSTSPGSESIEHSFTGEASVPRDAGEDPDPPLRIYNDSLPASMQPQTPQNLPETRHQSRLLGAHTAPLPRRWPWRGYPSSIQTPGLQGLFDRAENSEEENLYHEASLSPDDNER